jgi:acyl-CoA thioesterase I
MDRSMLKNFFLHLLPIHLPWSLHPTASVMKRFFSLLTVFTLACVANGQIRVACIGNSITFGHGLKKEETYPSQLQTSLGTDWLVGNFGVSGRTLLSKGDFPYVKERAFADAKAFAPDVVIIKLGTNDAKPQNWKFANEFVDDYTLLIKEFQSLPSHPTVMICLPVPAYGTNFRINDTVVNDRITRLVKEVAEKNEVMLIDLFGPLSGHPEWFADKIHPDAKGAAEIAATISKKLLKTKKKIKKRKPKKSSPPAS